MGALHQQKLQVCSNLSNKLSQAETHIYQQQLTDWAINDRNGVNQLVKSFKYKNFLDAMDFANRISKLADQEDHHPRICIEWGKVTVSWWTHTISGLFINDFIMAARCDEIYTNE